MIPLIYHQSGILHIFYPHLVHQIMLTMPLYLGFSGTFVFKPFLAFLKHLVDWQYLSLHNFLVTGLGNCISFVLVTDLIWLQGFFGLLFSWQFLSSSCSFTFAFLFLELVTDSICVGDFSCLINLVSWLFLPEHTILSWAWHPCFFYFSWTTWFFHWATSLDFSFLCLTIYG